MNRPIPLSSVPGSQRTASAGDENIRIARQLYVTRKRKRRCRSCSSHSGVERNARQERRKPNTESAEKSACRKAYPPPLPVLLLFSSFIEPEESWQETVADGNGSARRRGRHIRKMCAEAAYITAIHHEREINSGHAQANGAIHECPLVPSMLGTNHRKRTTQLAHQQTPLRYSDPTNAHASSNSCAAPALVRISPMAGSLSARTGETDVNTPRLQAARLEAGTSKSTCL